MNGENDTTIPQSSSKEKESNFSKYALYVLIGVFFLLPFFFLPFLFFPFQLTKVVLILVGVLIAFALFIIGRLKEGSISIPLSLVVGAAWLLPITYFFSALFSSASPRLSFIGQSFEVDTVFFITVNVLLLSLVPLLVRLKQRILSIYSGLLLGFIVIAIFQGIRLFLGADTLSFGIFTGNVANLIGKWNDLGIFFGLTAMLSLITLEGLSLHRFSKIVLYSVLVVSLFFLSIINFTSVWVVLGLFALGFSIYNILKRTFAFTSPDKVEGEGDGKKLRNVRGRGLSIASVLVLVISISFIIGGQSLSVPINSYFGITQIEARPSWQTTALITQRVYDSNLLLGSGPNSFTAQWVAFKPSLVNNTVFWNVDFSSGIGFIPTSFATTGILGAFSWIIFLGLFIYSGVRSLLLRPVTDSLSYYLSLSTFLSALYLWIFAVIYIPNAVILSFTFFFTGLYLASLHHQKDGLSEKKLIFIDNPRVGFVSVLGLTVLLIFTGVGVYLISDRYLSAVYFGRAVTVLNIEGDETEARRMTRKALSRAKIDTYARFSSTLESRRLNQILTDAETPIDERRTQFQEVLARAILSAQQARDINPNNYKNWLALGRIYQSVVPLQIQGAYESAIEAYDRALEIAPHNPEIYLNLAELEVLKGDNEKARERIGQALREKNNYTAAVFLLAQIQVNEDKIDEAIISVESATLLEPNNPVIFFQLGLLQYNNGDYEDAISALERAVALNDIYANAQYFLGLSYYRVARVEDAVAQFERVEKTNPDNEGVKRILTNLENGEDPLAGLNEENQNQGTPPIEGE